MPDIITRYYRANTSGYGIVNGHVLQYFAGVTVLPAHHPLLSIYPSHFDEYSGGTAWTNTSVGLEATGPSTSPSAVFVGMHTWTLRATEPSGWLFCYGQAISRSTYAALFAAISTAGGVGDGSTTFNVPDLRGRGPVGLDNMGGSDAGRLSVANTLGGVGGAETHALQTSEMPAHTHNVTTASGIGALGGVTALLGATQSTQTTSSTGGGGAHNNMQPYLLCNWLIYAGV